MDLSSQTAPAALREGLNLDNAFPASLLPYRTAGSDVRFSDLDLILKTFSSAAQFQSKLPFPGLPDRN